MIMEVSYNEFVAHYTFIPNCLLISWGWRAFTSLYLHFCSELRLIYSIFKPVSWVIHYSDYPTFEAGTSKWVERLTFHCNWIGFGWLNPIGICKPPCLTDSQCLTDNVKKFFRAFRGRKGVKKFTCTIFLHQKKCRHICQSDL